MTQRVSLKSDTDHSEEESKRQDSDCYCPRVDQTVLILCDTCFFLGKKIDVCQGCVFDGDFVRAKLILLTAEMLQERQSREGREREA